MYFLLTKFFKRLNCQNLRVINISKSRFEKAERVFAQILNNLPYLEIYFLGYGTLFFI